MSWYLIIISHKKSHENIITNYIIILPAFILCNISGPQLCELRKLFRSVIFLLKVSSNRGYKNKKLFFLELSTLCNLGLLQCVLFPQDVL